MHGGCIIIKGTRSLSRHGVCALEESLYGPVTNLTLPRFLANGALRFIRYLLGQGFTYLLLRNNNRDNNDNDDDIERNFQNHIRCISMGWMRTIRLMSYPVHFVYVLRLNKSWIAHNARMGDETMF